jgi:pyruvate kinase
MRLKRTKIVATLGPASSNETMIKKMYKNGLDVCRLNFSHGDYDVHKANIDIIKKVNEELNSNIAILADLQGPKLRVGVMENEGVEINEGDKIIFTTNKCVGTKEKVYMTYQNFPKDVQPGEAILIDDGKLKVVVDTTNGDDEVVCIVEHGGILKSKKGVNLPNTKISLPSLTEKDRNDLEFILTQNVEWIALSFVRSAKDIIELKDILKAHGSNSRVIAKIEKPEAIDDIDAIIEATDAIMVARGDLGIEVPYQDVPLLQKMMVKKCLKAAKPIIVATQMMESMIDGITPSRAEVNDVANAVMDGADAVMLSGETSVGIHPDLVVQTMSNIVSKVEEYDDIYNPDFLPVYRKDRFVTDNICMSAVNLAQNVGAKAVTTMTFSGYTAFKVSSHRPRAYIFVFTSNQSILNTVNLVWGVKGFYYDDQSSTDKTFEDLQKMLQEKGYLEKGDYFINIASMPIQAKGKTNTIKLNQVN